MFNLFSFSGFNVLYKYSCSTAEHKISKDYFELYKSSLAWFRVQEFKYGAEIEVLLNSSSY